MSNLTELRPKLIDLGQEHLLTFWDELSPGERERLAAQIEAIDFARLDQLVRSPQAVLDYAELSARAKPPRAARADGTGTTWSVDDAIDRGTDALAAGMVGLIIVAGGQGTRLGFDKPKGMFPIGPLSQRTLFQFHADLLHAVGIRYGVMIPLYVMTSPATHEETLAYFEETDNLGLPNDQIKVFCQGTMPAVDRESGKVLLASKGEIAVSPDGHGGTLNALVVSGCLADAMDQGIEHLTYLQIDNPLASPCDPAFIGHHILAGSDMTTQVVRKRDPLERVGNFVDVDGTARIIEYIHLPESAARQTEPDGSLRIWAGSIGIHVFKTSFLKASYESVDSLPFNQAFKKVPHINVEDGGSRVEPDEPNAIKFERFIFDLLPEATNPFVVEGLASEVFAPVKNADGAPTDTAASAKAAICDLHRNWLRSAAVTVGDSVKVEIHPGWAIDRDEVALRSEAGTTIDSDHYFAPDPDDDRLVVVARCNTVEETDIIRAHLSGEGIMNFAESVNSSVMLSGFITPTKGIPVLVRQRDAERASTVLEK